MDKCAVHLARRSTQQDSANSSLGDTEPAFKLGRMSRRNIHFLCCLRGKAPKPFCPDTGRVCRESCICVTARLVPQSDRRGAPVRRSLEQLYQLEGPGIRV